MAKKKKRSSQRSPNGIELPRKLTQDAQAAATKRMAQLLRELSKPPEGFLPMLERLGVNYKLISAMSLEDNEVREGLWDVGEVQFLDGKPTKKRVDVKYLMIKVSDLLEGEKKNQQEGSLLNQFNKRSSNIEVEQGN